jgi:hypothetical protein
MNKLVLPLLLSVTLTFSALAQIPIDLQAHDTLRTVLEHQVGQNVELRMRSGEKMGGKLQKVTDKLVHLAQLTGAEFYDAVVEIDAIAAVSVRTKAK